LLVIARPCRAQKDALAESLFREGKALMAKKRFEEACPKFAESQRLAPSSGATLALAFCYEGLGKVASAWGAFSATVTLGRQDARADRVKVATARLAALEPLLPRVSFVVPPAWATLSGFELMLDGAALSPAAWSGIPADPGDHTLEAHAPGQTTYTKAFTIGREPVPTTLVVPAPVPAPVAVVAPPPVPPPPAPAGFPWRTTGFVSVGVGAAGVVVGAILGGLALSDASTVHGQCPSGVCKSMGAVSEDATAGSLADASTGLLVAGGVLATAGLVAVLVAPAESSASRRTWVRAHPLVSLGFVGVGGEF
jgi:hypothetical protein